MNPDAKTEKDRNLEKKILCPKCDVMMKQIIISKPTFDIMIDHCSNCEGYWFDKEELDKLIDEENIDKGFPYQESDRDEADFKCPRCHGGVDTKVVYDIHVDLCSKCSGIWLDKGELHEVQREHRFERNQNKLLDLLQDVLDS